jgi:hypothetical protein
MDTSHNLEHPSLHQAQSSDSRISIITEMTPFITYTTTTHDCKDTPQILKLHSLQHGLILRSRVPTRERGSRYKLPGPGHQESDQEPDYIAHIFVFVGNVVICRLYKLILSNNAQVTLQMRVSLSNLV